MQKVLVRTGLPIFNQIDTSEILSHNMIGSNIGNLIFSYSMIRTLMTEDTIIDTMSTAHEYTSDEMDAINNEYAYVVLPFANAFRVSFIKELERSTRFIKKLKIPCIVAGIGIQAKIDEDVTKSFLFDQAVIEFVKAVLEKSSIMGVRGEVTAKYLKKLGFKEEVDFTVIGCPSMFLHGNEFPELRVKEITPDSAISLNWKLDLPTKIHNFMQKNIKLMNNYHYVPQILDEIRLMYYGVQLPADKYHSIPSMYPAQMDHEFYKNGNATSFVNIPSWMDYFETKDLSFGTRIHGNITALLAGTPCYIVASDARVQELALYHNIPHINYKELTNEMDVFKLYEQADYSAIYRDYDKKFEHFVQFLDTNNLDHIYKESRDIKEAPFDIQIQNSTFQEPLRPFTSVSLEEQSKRMTELVGCYTNQIHTSKQEISHLKRELKRNEWTTRNAARKIYRKVVPVKTK